MLFSRISIKFGCVSLRFAIGEFPRASELIELFIAHSKRVY